MKFANIIIDISHEKLDHPFGYIIPEELENRIFAGTGVMIPFGRGNRQIKGYVIEVTDKPSFDVSKMKKISSVIEGAVEVESMLIKLAWWIKENYGSTMNQALKTVIPVKNKVRAKENKTIVLNMTKDEALEKIEQYTKKHATARIRLLKELIDNDNISRRLVTDKLNISDSTIKSMEIQGDIVVNADIDYRNPVTVTSQPEYDIVLNNEQRCVAEEIKKTMNFKPSKFPNVHLIHGITGSGKTEVYMDLIDYTIKNGKSAIVLIPEIALTYQIVMRFTRRFKEKVSIVNSRMSAGEKYDQFERAKKGEISIMIGPRSALFTPFKNLGLIVIDEEHESAYKSESVPKYHAIEVAQKRGVDTGAAIVLGSATPSLESYYRAKKGIYKLYELKNRAAGADMPDVAVVDLREELKQGNRSIFSRKLKELIEDRIRKKQQIMLFLNKRGYAGFISCRSCGYVMKCPHCDISLTAHNNGRLVCHYCGYQTGSVKLCPKCGSRYISGFKAGTQQVEEMLKKTFPGIRVLRMDMDTTSGKDGHEKIISEFAAHNADVLVGTQMIVKGHDFPDVTLVGVLAADMSLYTSDFRAGERTFQLLVQAAGRAGRKNLHGDVIIQTYTPDNYSIVAAQKQDYEMFYDDEISFRKLMGYPPVMHMLEVKISSKNEGNLEKSCDDMKKFSDMAGDKKLFITGPVVPQVYKLNDIYTQVLYVKAADYERLTQFKDNIEVHVKDNILYKNVSVQFNFD